MAEDTALTKIQYSRIDEVVDNYLFSKSSHAVLWPTASFANIKFLMNTLFPYHLRQYTPSEIAFFDMFFSPRAGPFSYFYLFHLFPNTNLSPLIIFNTSKFIHIFLSPCRNITMHLLLSIVHDLRGIHQYISFINKPQLGSSNCFGHWLISLDFSNHFDCISNIFVVVVVSGTKIEKVDHLSNLLKTFAFQF